MFRTRIALGIAAAVLTLTSLVSSSVPASAAPLFRPDIQVTYLYEHPLDGSQVFRIKNIGSVASGPVAVKELCAYLTQAGPSKRLVNGAHVLPPIGAGQQVQTSISCNTAPWGVAAFGARLEAGTQDDLDTSNNAATSPFYGSY